MRNCFCSLVFYRVVTKPLFSGTGLLIFCKIFDRGREHGILKMYLDFR